MPEKQVPETTDLEDTKCIKSLRDECTNDSMLSRKSTHFWKTTFQSEEKKHGSLIYKWLHSTLDKFCIKRIISSQRCNAVSLVTLRKSFQPGLSPPNHNPTKIMLLKATLKIGGRFAMAIHTGQSKLFRDLIILTSSKLNMRKIFNLFESSFQAWGSLWSQLTTFLRSY